MLLGFDDGAAEADRLAKVVSELPGVESIEAGGTQQNVSFAASALVYVQMSAGASPEDLERVILEWEAAAAEREDAHIRRVLEVKYRTDDCVSKVKFGADVQRLKDSAQFLPALCAAVEGGDVLVEDDWQGRVVRVTDPDLPVDVTQIRTLPGATSDHDYWNIEGTSYRWFAED